MKPPTVGEEGRQLILGDDQTSPTDLENKGGGGRSTRYEVVYSKVYKSCAVTEAGQTVSEYRCNSGVGGAWDSLSEDKRNGYEVRCMDRAVASKISLLPVGTEDGFH